VVAPPDRETCDDGDLGADDGCDTQCGIEAGYTCFGVPGDCALPVISTGNDAIPDNTYNGTIGSMVCRSIMVPAARLDVVEGLWVSVALTHTWVGDLVIKLVSPIGTAITLMHRPGNTMTADNGGTGGGNGFNTNLAGSSPVVFAEGVATIAENMGAGGGVICASDGGCVFAPNAGPAAPGTLSTLLGQLASGTWQLCVGDDAAQDTGTLGDVRLGIVRNCADGQQDNDGNGTCAPSCEGGAAGCAPSVCDDSTGAAICP
jgi:cysteine-rich repeat protein